jgi:CheY-like chemotaxis protein
MICGGRETSSAAEALTRIRFVHPDVVILDVRLPDGDDIEVCREHSGESLLDPHLVALARARLGRDEEDERLGR